jgi:hypothetical protein
MDEMPKIVPVSKTEMAHQIAALQKALEEAEAQLAVCDHYGHCNSLRSRAEAAEAQRDALIEADLTDGFCAALVASLGDEMEANKRAATAEKALEEAEAKDREHYAAWKSDMAKWSADRARAETAEARCKDLGEQSRAARRERDRFQKALTQATRHPRSKLDDVSEAWFVRVKNLEADNAALRDHEHELQTIIETMAIEGTRLEGEVVALRAEVERLKVKRCRFCGGVILTDDYFCSQPFIHARQPEQEKQQ